MPKISLPTIKVVYQPVKTVVPICSPAAIAEQEAIRRQQKAIYDRNQAEIEARRKLRAEQATRLAAMDAMADQSTRH